MKILCYSLAILFGTAHALFSQAIDLKAELESSLKPFVEKQELAGAIAVVVGPNKVVALHTVGYSDIAGKTAMPPDAMFWIASQSKSMTAVAVMMLVDEGKISLDDPVEKYLPEFRDQEVLSKKDGEKPTRQKPGHPITLRDVLSHMSGLPFKSAVETPTLDGLPLAEAVRSYAAAPLQSEPGTQYQYSNAGINTAARVLEVVSGKPYETFMQDRLFTPLGMKDTTFWPNADQIERIAKSYRPNKTKDGLDEFRTNQLSYPLNKPSGRYPMPAGGLYSTAKDTAAFCQMMLRGGEVGGKRYLSEAAFNECAKRQTPKTVKQSYGLGFSVGGDSFGHGGALATNMTIYPAKGLAIVWLVQHGEFPGEGAKAQSVFRQWALEHFGK